MPCNCFVRDCPTGSRRLPKQKNHFFSPPNDPEMFAKWSQACYRKDRPLKMTSKICQRHFREEEIRKEAVVNLPDGNVLTVPLLNWRLRPKTVPGIFIMPQIIVLTRNDDVHTYAATSSNRSTSVDECVLIEHVGTPNESRPEVKDIVTAAVNECILDVQGCLAVPQPNNKLEVEMTSGPAIKPSTSINSESHIRSTETSRSNHITDSDELAEMKIEVYRAEQEVTKWKNKSKALGRLYKRWKSKYHRLNKQRQRKKEKAIRDGVFIPYSKLNPQEVMYANALARKAHVKSAKGMRYTRLHMLQSVLTSLKGKKTYELMRKNCIQVMPSYQTVQKLKRSMLNAIEGSNQIASVENNDD